jgi:hypothetical protein
MNRRAFLQSVVLGLAAAPFVRTFGADVVSPLTSALPRIVSMSNPVGPEWQKQWLRNFHYAQGRQWLRARECVFDEQSEVEVEWYEP